ncbi:MAG: HAD-IC family P-type ATPase, partial [Thermoanaerobaculia bacterium]
WAHAPSAETGRDAVVFACEDEPVAVIHTEERLRPDAANEIRALHDAGYDVRILSGDTSSRVSEVARQLGIAEDHVSGGCTPDDKARWLAANDRHDTLMIGDGINDALALTTAFASGTPAVDRPFVPSRADFYFTTAGLHPIALVLAAARKLTRVHRRNLCVALAYNAFAVGFAAAGFITPIICAIVMPLSSLTLLLTTTASFAKGSSAWRS